MCALFGWLDYKGIVSCKLLKKLTQALANAAEERGTDASGISYIHDGNVVIYKRPKPAHKIRFAAPDDTRAMMGHTRMTTQGNEQYNYNNHPFLGHADISFALAHNGVLYNDKSLRREKQLPETFIETDSYIAVQLIEQQKKLDFSSLQSMAESVQGNFTFTVLDTENSLYIIKGNNPMCLLHFSDLGLYIYASTESILAKALKKINLLNVPFSKIEVTQGEILRISSDGLLTRSKFKVQNNFDSIAWMQYAYDWEDAYYTQQEQLLLETCGCYGITEDDVILLLDYGYTADEIEDMLGNHTLIHDTIQAVLNETDNSNYFMRA